VDEELIRDDPPRRLLWGDTAGWTVQRKVVTGDWLDVATYSETPPLAARPFIRWLASQTRLTFDLAEDAVLWLRDQSPARFVDPHDEVS
jgi:hypothetical protein